MMQGNHDDRLSPTLFTISTLRCLMQLKINMKKQGNIPFCEHHSISMAEDKWWIEADVYSCPLHLLSPIGHLRGHKQSLSYKTTNF